MKTQEEIMAGSHTCCGDCIFAHYENNVQTHCSAYVLEKIRKHYNVIEAEDGEKKFFVIDGTKCYYKRDEKWKEKHGVTPYIAQHEIRMQYDGVIYLPPAYIMDDLVDSIMSFIKQEILPKSIVVCNHSKTRGTELFTLMNELVARVGLKWQVIDIDTDLKEMAIHETIRKCTSLYYALIDCGQMIRNDYMVRVNTQINEYHKKFSILIPETEKEPFLSSTVLFCGVGGNNEESFENKIRQLDVERKMVKTFSQLCRE